MFKYILSFGLVALLLVSCDDYADLDDVQPINSVTPELAVTDKKSAQAAVIGLYDAMQNGTLSFDGWLAMPQYFSDECDFTGTFPTRLQFGNFNVFPDNTTMAAVFTAFYSGINRCNNVIALIPEVEDPTLSEADINSFLAEAYFIRSMFYFYLIQGWDEVPLVTEPTREVGLILEVPKNTRAEVVSQMVTDLTFALDNLVDGLSSGVSVAAVNALLARLHQVEGNHQEAYNHALAAIGGGGFDLTNFDYLADEIFFLQFAAIDANALAFFYGPAEFGGRHSIEPSRKLIDSYEDGDIRKGLSIVDDPEVASVPFGIKYDDFAGGISAGSDPIMFFRHAEMVLIAAESAARAGDFANANKWYNQVRNRAGLGDQTLDANNFEDLILQERFVELAMEGGHRLWDLRRTGRALDVLGPLGYQACDNVWPLPQREIDRNRNLVQNNCCNC